MELPIIFIHFGNSYYLKDSLTQAKKSNPNSNLILIGDDSNNVYEFIKHYNFKDYSKKANEFLDIYEHFSTNSYQFEVFCIQRWFILLEFLKKHNINSCYYQDSDVMLYTNVKKESSELKNYGLAYVDISGHTAYINNIDTLELFCNFIWENYLNSDKHKALEKIYIDYRKTHKFGGICDMTFFSMFSSEYPKLVFNLSVINENSTYDNNINVIENFCSVYNHKKIIFINEQPYSQNLKLNKLIRFKTLHFQGKAKRFMKFSSEKNIKKMYYLLPFIYYKDVTINLIKNFLRPLWNKLKV